MAQKITPNIWANNNAKEMAEWYQSIFPDSRIVETLYYPKTKEEGLADFQLNMAGKELVIDLELCVIDLLLLMLGTSLSQILQSRFL